MVEDFLGFLRRSLNGLAFAMILAAVPGAIFHAFAQTPPTSAQASPPANGTAIPGPTAQSLGPAVVPGVAVGDCAEAGQAMVRSYPYSTAPAMPPNPAVKACEGGRIQMRVEAPRHFGHRLMDPIRVRILLAVDPSVVIDMQSLARGVLALNGQEFDLVPHGALGQGQSPVDVEMRRLRDGRNLLKIELVVQSTVPPSVAPYLLFRLDLRYALGNIRDAQGNATTSPDWRVLSTPAFAFTLSPTATPGDGFRENDDEEVPQVVPWPTYGLLVAGILLVLLGPGIAVVRWLNRMRPGRKTSREEIAWRNLDRLFVDAGKYGFSHGHFRAIVQVVRRYFNLQSATIAELNVQLSDHPNLQEIIRVVSRCEAVLYRGKTLSEAEIEELMADVARIVPRP